MIRDSIIAMAEQELGTLESPPESNVVKYNNWYYPEFLPNGKRHPYFVNSKPYSWCASFVSYVYHFAGWTLPYIDTEIGFHYVPTLYHKAKAKRWETDNPIKGDIVIFDFKQDKVIDHVGIFHSWLEKGKTFTCIEGNTSAGEKGSQSNGGGVFKRVRNIRDVIQFVNILDNYKL